MNLEEFTLICRDEVPYPKDVQGDPWGIDATTEDIQRLLDSSPKTLVATDFSGYLGYCTTGGDGDLAYLLPAILRIWEKELYIRDSWYTPHFHAEISRTDFINRALIPRLREAMLEFMLRALSKRIASEKSLFVKGVSTSHDWFGQYASFGVITYAIRQLWTELWDSDQLGHVLALMQYLSCLLYEDEKANPIFSPWTYNEGGGPPELWGYDSMGFEESWKKENLDFLSSSLNSQSIHDWLHNISFRYPEHEVSNISTVFLEHLQDSLDEVDERIKLLLVALGKPSGTELTTWNSLRAYEST